MYRNHYIFLRIWVSDPNSGYVDDEREDARDDPAAETGDDRAVSGTDTASERAPGSAGIRARIAAVPGIIYISTETATRVVREERYGIR
jgi:hypothetical protein